MVELIPHGVYLLDGQTIVENAEGLPGKDEARENTIAYSILRSHDVEGGKGSKLKVRFDAMASHDITYVGIIQTARASGLEKFPIPYAMTNCHNSLCAVGGTINEDDHVFGLSAAKKYGGIYVPANQAVIHQYVREALATCGGMVLGSDSHTRYGSLGCMGVGEGGGELVKQLLHNTWDINAPEVVLVWLEGKPKHGVGPHDVAISLVKATFESGFVKNKVLEFAGPGVKELPIDFRNGIDVMTTETTCLSSIWVTDETVKKHYETHRRPEAYKELKPGKVAWYDSMIRIDLSSQESMIALPFHPSNAFTIHELQADPEGILKAVEADAKKRFGDKVQIDLMSKIKDGKVCADQALIAGCSGGTYDNLSEAASILKGKTIGNDYFTMSAYPQSTPVYLATTREHIAEELLEAGADNVTIHGRTPAQRYEGSADRNEVLGAARRFPGMITASGDVYSPQDVKNYLDGGCAEKIPFPWAESSGEKKIVVVRTRELSYRREPGLSRAARFMYRRYPELLSSMEKTNGNFNSMVGMLEEKALAGEIFLIAPSRHVTVTRFDGDMDKLGALYLLGFCDMKSRLAELRGYLGK